MEPFYSLGQLSFQFSYLMFEFNILPIKMLKPGLGKRFSG